MLFVSDKHTMPTLRALSMEKVVTEDLSPDLYPQTLLEEIQDLKKLRDSVLHFHLYRSKKRCVQKLWDKVILDASISFEEDLSSTQTKTVLMLEEALIWFQLLMSEIFMEMSKTRREGIKLLKCVPSEYHYICSKNIVNNYETFIAETKQRLLEIIDEYYQYAAYVTRSVEKNRKYSRQAINCLNFAL